MEQTHLQSTRLLILHVLLYYDIYMQYYIILFYIRLYAILIVDIFKSFH